MVMPQQPQYITPQVPVSPGQPAPVDQLQDAIIAITNKGESLSFSLDFTGLEANILQTLTMDGSGTIAQLTKRLRTSPQAVKRGVGALLKAKMVAITKKHSRGFL